MASGKKSLIASMLAVTRGSDSLEDWPPHCLFNLESVPARFAMCRNWVTEAPGRPGSLPAAVVSGRSRAASWSALTGSAPYKATRSRYPVTATPPSRAVHGTTTPPGRHGSSPAAMVSGPSRAASWSATTRLAALSTKAVPSRYPVRAPDHAVDVLQRGLALLLAPTSVAPGVGTSYAASAFALQTCRRTRPRRQWATSQSVIGAPYGRIKNRLASLNRTARRTCRSPAISQKAALMPSAGEHSANCSNSCAGAWTPLRFHFEITQGGTK